MSIPSRKFPGPEAAPASSYTSGGRKQPCGLRRSFAESDRRFFHPGREMPPLDRAGWVGRAHHRAKKVVANRETIGQGVIEGNGCARVLAHAQYGVVGIKRNARTAKRCRCTAVP